MPIIHMTNKPEAAPAGAVNLRKLDGHQGMENWWLYDTHIGLCIKEGEHNYRDDSDFYMVVWNRETHKPEEIEFATTRGWTYPCYGSSADATPEVMAEYEAYQQARREEAEKAYQARLARTPARGKVLKVVRGRKVAIGTTGTCIWTGKSNWGERVGIKDQAGQVHWTAASNVEVVLTNPTGSSTIECGKEVAR